MATNPTDARRITRQTSSDTTARGRDRAPDLSSGWESVYAELGVSTSIESTEQPEPSTETIAAATRGDRPDRYRRKHALEVST